MQTTRHPYEFLARWDRSGRLSGAHAQFRYVTTAEDGSVLGEFVGPAEPVAVMDAAGFPLSDILPSLQIAALAERDAALAERDALAARLAEWSAGARPGAADAPPAAPRSGDGGTPAG